MRWKRFFSRLYLLLRHWAEPTRLYVDSFEPVNQHTLTVTSVVGFDISIRCIERNYREIPVDGERQVRAVSVYELSASVTDDAPQALKDATQIKISLPQPYPKWVSSDLQVDRVIQQYLDLLTRHIELHAFTTV